MTALSADRQIIKGDPEIGAAPVAASTKIWAGSLVCRNSSGYAAKGADTAGFIFAGVAREQADNSAGSNGTISVELYVEGTFKFAASGLAITDVGKPLYVLDDQTVVTGDGAVAEGVYVGILEEYISATSAWVRLDPAKRLKGKGDAQIFHIVADGVNTAALDLTTVATQYGGSDIYVTAVVSLVSHNTTAGNAEALLVTTDYTLASGVITLTADRSAAGTKISGAILGRLKE